MEKKTVIVLLFYLPKDLTGQSHCLEPRVKMESAEGAQSNTNANQRRKEDQ